MRVVWFGSVGGACGLYKDTRRQQQQEQVTEGHTPRGVQRVGEGSQEKGRGQEKCGYPG